VLTLSERFAKYPVDLNKQEREESPIIEELDNVAPDGYAGGTMDSELLQGTIAPHDDN
jgi:hypothetical protein